jgi:cephalosporin hydroxylase
MKPNLNKVTLVCIDCINVNRAIETIEKSIEDCDFAEIKLFTSLETDYQHAIKIPPIKTIKEYSIFVIKELFKYVDTEYMIIIQHDGWVANPDVWNDDFYKYDYIGGICNWMDSERKGGNGGFSMRSTKLMKKASEIIPVEYCHPEDVALSAKFNNDLINNTYLTGFRIKLEEFGFVFADINVQKIFSWEGGPYRKTFGFHKCDMSSHPKYKKWYRINLDYQYEKRCNSKSDINEHLPILAEYSSKCESVVEFGVRYGNSSYGILFGKPKKITSYDIHHTDVSKDIKLVAEDNNIDYQFIVSDSRTTNIPNTDMLFIDTEHTYEQLIIELNRHSFNVNKYILIHDTVTFGLADKLKTTSPKKGLIAAIQDFLTASIDGKNWIIETEYKNNNGLMVLKRIKESLKNEHLLIIYRYHDKDIVNERKVNCLNNLFDLYKKSVTENGYFGQFYLICDNVSDYIMENIKKRIDESIIVIRTDSTLSDNKFNHRGHFSFYETSINIAKDACNENNKHLKEHFVFFCEDDYEYREDSIDTAISHMRKYKQDFVSLYDHPDRYKHGSLREENFHPYYKLEVVHDKLRNHHWRTAISTCHSFAVNWEGFDTILKETDIFSKKFGDHQMWINIWQTGKHKLWTPMPGLSIHWGGPHIHLVPLGKSK